MAEKKETPEYRLQYEIVDVTNDEIVMKGSTYITPESISRDGECESVEMEIGSALRSFERTVREEYEEENYSEASEEEDDNL